MGRYFLFFCTLLVYTVSQAQNSKWTIYPSLGIDMGGAVPFPFSDIPKGAGGTPKLNPLLGIGYSYSISMNWMLSMEVNYHILEFSAHADVRSQSFYFDNHEDILYFSGSTKTNVELRLIEFPMVATCRAGKNWSLQFGPYYSLLLEGTFTTEGTDGVLSPDKAITDNAVLPGIASAGYNFNNQIDTYDAGLFFGYCYHVNDKLFFFGRFHCGFKSIFVKEFNTIEYDMYQLRLSIGASYSLFSKSIAREEPT